jgi:hypothetical protein
MVVNCPLGIRVSIDPVSKQNPALFGQVLVCSVYAGFEPRSQPAFQPPVSHQRKAQA